MCENKQRFTIHHLKAISTQSDITAGGGALSNSGDRISKSEMSYVLSVLFVTERSLSYNRAFSMCCKSITLSSFSVQRCREPVACRTSHLLTHSSSLRPSIHCSTTKQNHL